MDVWLRDGDWRMPVRPGGVLEFFDGLTVCGECDAGVLLESLAVHVRMAKIVSVIQDGTTRNPLQRERMPLPHKPLAPPLRGPITPERKAELREQRRRRSHRL
jgi:hypothetical protein